MTRHKHEEVVGTFPCVGLAIGVCSLMENHDPEHSDFASAQAVFRQDHNLFVHTTDEASQKGRTFALEVAIEAGCNVRDDRVVEERCLEVLDLALQVFFLAGAADSDVATRFLFDPELEVVAEVADVVESLPMSSIADASHTRFRTGRRLPVRC